MNNWFLWLGLAVLVFVIILYNRIVSLRQERRNALSDIDVQLKVRSDLIPNLVETVKGYAGHESRVLTEVTAARANVMKGGAWPQRLEAEKTLGTAIGGLLAVAENYPQLKADAGFLRLQTELSDVENKIAAARRFFNNTTAEYNAAIQQFPAVFIARLMNAKEEPYFELNDQERAAVATPPSVKF